MVLFGVGLKLYDSEQIGVKQANLMGDLDENDQVSGERLVSSKDRGRGF